jgi:hypothetical protein
MQDDWLVDQKLRIVQMVLGTSSRLSQSGYPQPLRKQCESAFLGSPHAVIEAPPLMHL